MRAVGSWVALVAAFAAACGAGEGAPPADTSASDAPADASPDSLEVQDIDASPDSLDLQDIDASPDSLDLQDIDASLDSLDVRDIADTWALPPLGDASPLPDAPGLAVALERVTAGPEGWPGLPLHLVPGAPEPTVRVGSAPATFEVPDPAVGPPRLRADAALELAPFTTYTFDPPLLVTFAAATSATFDVTLPGTATPAATLTFGPGSPSRERLAFHGLTLDFVAFAGVPPLALTSAHLGLTLDGATRAAVGPDLEALVAGRAPILLKAYHGARRFLLEPGCFSDAACQVGGPSYPCVERCACSCDTTACSCDFSTLEASMRERALAVAARYLGDSTDLALVSLHYVFKRSLGGTRSCDESGELDVSPATYAAFFAAATRAATRINRDLGHRLIASLSPMNEANHPLQDGSHRNAAGQPTVGGFLDFRDVLFQATGCAPDRYLVADPDVPALLAAALVAAEAARLEDPTWAPEIGLSLYLDTEQTDPLQLGPDGAPPSIVSPLPVFLPQLAAHLPPDTPLPLREVWVDTYPGSWAPPWTDLDGVHHIDPATGLVLRMDPIAAADAAVHRALTAADDLHAAFPQLPPPSVVLGEVGWSTFDGDHAAQATFLARLLDASALAHHLDLRYRGLLWFKDTDRAAYVAPTWTEARFPGSDVTLPCDDGPITRYLCMVDVFALMENAWGLLARGPSGELTPKPAWSLFRDALALRVRSRTPTE